MYPQWCSRPTFEASRPVIKVDSTRHAGTSARPILSNDRPLRPRSSVMLHEDNCHFDGALSSTLYNAILFNLL